MLKRLLIVGMAGAIAMAMILPAARTILWLRPWIPVLGPLGLGMGRLGIWQFRPGARLVVENYIKWRSRSPFYCGSPDFSCPVHPIISYPDIYNIS